MRSNQGWGIAIVSDGQLDMLLAPVLNTKEDAQVYLDKALNVPSGYTYVLVQLKADLADKQYADDSTEDADVIA